jgi:hypothetical protein
MHQKWKQYNGIVTEMSRAVQTLTHAGGSLPKRSRLADIPTRPMCIGQAGIRIHRLADTKPAVADANALSADTHSSAGDTHPIGRNLARIMKYLLGLTLFSRLLQWAVPDRRF